jgi:hypothetical protein
MNSDKNLTGFENLSGLVIELKNGVTIYRMILFSYPSPTDPNGYHTNQGSP